MSGGVNLDNDRPVFTVRWEDRPMFANSEAGAMPGTVVRHAVRRLATEAREPDTTLCGVALVRTRNYSNRDEPGAPGVVSGWREASCQACRDRAGAIRAAWEGVRL